MNDFIIKATPLGLVLVLNLVAVVAVLISQGTDLMAEKDSKKRESKAWHLLISSLPQNMCLAAFSYDIWAITILLSSDAKTLTLYNLTNKNSAIQLLIVVHVFLYIFALAWGGMVRGGGSSEQSIKLELFLAIIAILLCIGFQAY